MREHSLQTNAGARKRKTRVGRGMGSGKGKTCGRGHKGQMSRKGHKHKAGFEGGQMKLIRRLPKRGFTAFRKRVWAPVNISDLAQFDAESEITSSVLRARGFGRGNTAGIKILGRGELDRKLTVKVQAFSTSARAKITAAGGVCEVVED